VILAAALLLGSVAVGWWSPRLLSRLISARTDPGTAIAWWLPAAAGVITETATAPPALRLTGTHDPRPIPTLWLPDDRPLAYSPG
jgi:hypothetical protein